jgi:hypothetical protein
MAFQADACFQGEKPVYECDRKNILLTSFLKNFNESNTQYKLLRNAERCLP